MSRLADFYQALSEAGAQVQALDVEFKYQSSDPFAIRDALLSNEPLLTKALGFVLCANLFGTKPSTGGLRDDRKNKFSESAKRAIDSRS